MNNMEDYLDEMLHLTADIAEELLTIKDTGQPLGDTTTEKIARLAEIAVTYRLNAPAAISVTDSVQEIAAAPALPDMPVQEPAQSEPDAEVAPEPQEPEMSCQQAQDNLEMGESAVLEEEADADVAEVDSPEQQAVAPRRPALTARELRNAFTLNDVFLYQRTIFHGSSAEFKAALEEIASLSTVAELRDYLAKVHGADLESSEVESFIETVGTYLHD